LHAGDESGNGNGLPVPIDVIFSSYKIFTYKQMKGSRWQSQQEIVRRGNKLSTMMDVDMK
jgi:hypothetical protein